MFQYAFYKSLEQYFATVKADISGFKNYPLHNGFELERVFHLKLRYSSNIENLMLGGGPYLLAKAWKIICKLIDRYYYCKSPLYFDPNIFKDKGNTYYWGYWQNERYFSNISDQIRSDFTFRNRFSEKNVWIKDMINSTNSVSIHIRRGDYVDHPRHGGICDTEYYHKAIKYIDTKILTATYFVFSNDIAWCKNNLDIANCYYIDWNKGEESYIDMQLMSLCQHNIIANSSFSWWGAWLNNNSHKIVISPSRWFNEGAHDINDIIPNSWICL